MAMNAATIKDALLEAISIEAGYPVSFSLMGDKLDTEAGAASDGILAQLPGVAMVVATLQGAGLRCTFNATEEGNEFVVGFADFDDTRCPVSFDESIEDANVILTALDIDDEDDGAYDLREEGGREGMTRELLDELGASVARQLVARGMQAMFNAHLVSLTK